MKKNIKKIIHVFCLVLLLFTCNKTIGKNGAIAIVPSVNVKQKLILLEKLSKNYALVPRAHVGFSITEASTELDKLIKHKESPTTNPITYNKIKNILMSYSSESKISILDENDNCIGICDTKGWIEDEATRTEVATVKRKFALLPMPKLNKNSDSFEVCTILRRKKKE